MPLAFPSHQGLILPLWRRYPARLDGVALCVGAAMPDLVDAAAWPARGELGQWLGHSLLGVVGCVPAGLALAWLARRITPRPWLARLEAGAPASPGLVRAGLSVAGGALSHVVLDFITHGNFLLLWPWYGSDDAFPSWWYHAWGGIPVPVYREPYPFAPHTIAWIALSILGAVLFVRTLRRAPRAPG
ncbi:MAG: DUF4184 family protein [Planctomycetota bacterium]|jgi:hypothetical protein